MKARRYFLSLALLSAPLLARAQNDPPQPFKQYGYKVQVLTLSKGKYQEFFENDSLRKIGSVVFDTRRKKIAQLLPVDTLRFNRPDVMSRWLSVDPLAEEFPDETPYNFCHNNPLRFVDKDGRKPDDYHLYSDGRVQVHKTSAKSDTYVYHNSDGSTKNLGTYQRNSSGLIKMSSPGEGWVKARSNEKNYLHPKTAAGFLGAAKAYSDETGRTVNVNQFTTSDGKHSGHPANGTNVDVQYMSSNGSTARIGQTNVDSDGSQALINTFNSFDFNSPNGSSILTENTSSNGPAFDNTSFVDGNGSFEHQSHFHLQRFNSSHISAYHTPIPAYIPFTSDFFRIRLKHDESFFASKLSLCPCACFKCKRPVTLQ